VTDQTQPKPRGRFRAWRTKAAVEDTPSDTVVETAIEGDPEVVMSEDDTTATATVEPEQVQPDKTQAGPTKPKPARPEGETATVDNGPSDRDSDGPDFDEAPGGSVEVQSISDLPIPESALSERHPRPLPRVIAIANQKGGVGKTTTTINLGAALAEQDRRVLIIDLDPQGNATTGLGINSRSLERSVYDVLLNDTALEDCVEATAVLNLFLAPASLDLAGAEIELVSVMSRETRLKRAIDEVKFDYDYVLIDCPPSLGLLTVNALAAASEVMVPIQCEYYALEGLGQLLRNVDLIQRNLNPLLELSLIVLVMYDGRTKLGEQVAFEVREHFGERVCRNVIPRNIRLSEAPSFGQPITVYDTSSTGAVAYRELAREVHSGSA
jgi:chromosome partitioning protein